MTTTIKKTGRPLPLAGESNKEFRMRAILWILQQGGAMSSDDIVAAFNTVYKTDWEKAQEPRFRTTKESVTRTSKDLKARGQVEYLQGEDKRRWEWSLVEEEIL